MNKQLTVVLTSLMLSCPAPNKNDTIMKEAVTVHNDAIVLAAQLEKQLDELAADSTLIKDSVLAWRAAIKNWEKELIEVRAMKATIMRITITVKKIRLT